MVPNVTLTNLNKCSHMKIAHSIIIYYKLRLICKVTIQFSGDAINCNYSEKHIRKFKVKDNCFKCIRKVSNIYLPAVWNSKY